MSEDLQFDRAEYTDTAAATTCAQCNGALAGAYFAVGDRVLCPPCAETLRAELSNQGSRAGRVLRATGAGGVAALLGSVLYYVVLTLTGYEFGLIAIVVGYAVGAAVRWGSNARGGWAYQGLAIALTYLSIVSAYVPPIIQAISQDDADRPAAAAPVAGSTTPDANVRPASVSAAREDSHPRLTLGRAVLGIGFLIALACAAPFLAGLQNIIGLVIIGIGLYEAWKLNRRTSVEITGPHQVNAPA